MPKTTVDERNANLAKVKPSKGELKKIAGDVIDKIKSVSGVMRDKNNIIIGANYRLDAKQMSSAADGCEIGDYKVDIQTVTKQKNLSDTVAVAFVSVKATETSLQDLKDALTDSATSSVICRVT